MINKPKVYIASGFYQGTDERVASQLTDRWHCLLPKESGLKEPGWFTPLDFGLIDTSRAMILCLESQNPGRNCLVEVGYAKRAGKIIVVHAEPDYFEVQGIPERYIGMALSSADYYTRDLDDACLWLNQYADRAFPPQRTPKRRK